MRSITKLYVTAILSTLCLTDINLAAQRPLSDMTELVEHGIDETMLSTVGGLIAGLMALYHLRALFRFLSNYLAHHLHGILLAVFVQNSMI